jgi:type III pantothenate kinase
MRSLVLNLGNSSVFGGVFEGRRLVSSFKISSRLGLRTLETELKRHLPAKVDHLALCSVVPRLTTPLSRLLRRTYGQEPRILNAAAQHGLRIGYHDPLRLGSDRLAAVLGARSLSPGSNLIIVDCGTATTVTALTSKGLLAGGAILPGLGLWAEVLAAQTAQLPRLTPVRPRSPLGRSPEEAILSGLFHGHAGAIRELIGLVAKRAFKSEKFEVYGTGGNAPLFAKEKLFTRQRPFLILTGLMAYAIAPKAHA